MGFMGNPKRGNGESEKDEMHSMKKRLKWR
jgi:hypothetical protein